MNASATQAFLFPNIAANVSMEPAGISSQMLLLQILNLAQQSSQTQSILIQQYLNLLNNSQDSQKQFDDIKKTLLEPKHDNTTIDQYQNKRLEVQDKNKTLEDLQVQILNYNTLVQSIRDELHFEITINDNLNREILELQQNLTNISSELSECKIKPNKTIIYVPANFTEEISKQLKSIQTKFEVSEHEKETMETEQKQLKVLADEAKNIRKKQALNKAVAENNLEKVKILLEAGVSTETVDSAGNRPLYRASAQGNLEIVKLLVQYGANLTSRMENRFGSSCIHVAASVGRKEVLQFLLDKGVPVDIRNKYGDTALGAAAWDGQYDVAKMLIQRGADVNDHMTTFDFRTPLHEAAHRGHVKVVELLLDHGADINILDRDNETALFSAAKTGELEVAKLLVKRGINVNLKNTSGKTAKQTATEYNFLIFANFLVSE